MYLLLFSGGIHPNPGPIKNPSSICSKVVRSNQRAILCDGCHMWSHHCTCNSVDTETYELLMYSEGFDWLCNKCCLSELPFANYDDPTSCEDDESAVDDTAADNDNRADEYQYHGVTELSGFEKDRSVLPHVADVNSKPNRSNKSIKVALVNVRSLLSCLEDVWHSISSESIDLLGLNETWLDKNVSDDEVCLRGFSIVRNDRTQNGGGVAMMIADHIPHRPRYDVSKGLVEFVWVELFPGSLNRSVYVQLYVVYIAHLLLHP